jgi:hypothetical protein
VPIVLPTPAASRLTAADAGEIARRGRKLLRRGLLTHRQYALLDALLWSCRKPGSSAAVVSYTALQRLAHQARETIAAGLRRLEALGLLSRIKRRVRFAWQGRVQASRQAVSAYILRVPADTATEFGPATVIPGVQVLHLEQADTRETRAAQAALDRRRREMEDRLRQKTCPPR